MADIIDLDFYRKFRIVLPMRPSKLAKSNALMISQTHVRPVRRKRRVDPDPKQTRKK